MPEVVEIDPITGPGAEGARRATGGPGPVTGSRASDPDPEVPAKVERRRFPPRVSAPHPQGSRRVQAARRGGRPAASRGVVLVALDELAAAARGGRPAGHARAPPGPARQVEARDANGGTIPFPVPGKTNQLGSDFRRGARPVLREGGVCGECTMDEAFR